MIYFISKVSTSASIRLLPSDYRSLWTDCRLDSVSSPSVHTVIASCSMNVESRDLELTGPTYAGWLDKYNVNNVHCTISLILHLFRVRTIHPTKSECSGTASNQSSASSKANQAFKRNKFKFSFLILPNNGE